MNRIFLSLLLCLPVLFGACTTATTDDEYLQSKEPVITILSFGMDPLADPAKNTRSDGSVDEDIAEETSIHDLNIYLWDGNAASPVVHKYQASGNSATVTLTPGTYQLRVVANVGRDMGEMTLEELDKTCSGDLLTEQQQRRTLLFAAKQQVAISGLTTAFDVVLKRVFARAYINVQVSPFYAQILSVISAEVCNIPTTAALFNAPEGSDNYPAAELCTGISKMKRAADGKLSDVIYIYENLKPSNPLITTQNKRGRENAPAGATYIHILTQSIAGFHHYYIYLGENTTSDFTVRRNTSVKYDVTITGMNGNDYRVEYTRFSLEGHSTRCDLETWPTSNSEAVLNYGTYRLDGLSTEFQEGRYWAKSFADQHSLDNGVTWIESDTTAFLPLTNQNNYGIAVRDFASSIPHPGAITATFVESYYKDGDFCQLNNNPTKKGSYWYGYTVNFKIEGLDAYSEFELGPMGGEHDNYADGVYILNRDYSTTGTFSIFAYPERSIADTPHFDMSFSWPSKYKFLGFYNKDGVKFNATDDVIKDTDTSWSTNGKGTTTVFWRDANLGSGDIYLRFESKSSTMSVGMTQRNKNSTCKLNRNRITLTDAARTGSVKVQYSCTEGQGIFLRNATLNASTGLYEGTAVTSYEQTCAFISGKAQVPEVVFVPFTAGAVSYKVAISDAASGALIKEQAVTNTIAKSTMEATFDFAISKESVNDLYLEYNTPGGYVGYMKRQYGISPYKLYAYAVAQKGGGLEYWSAGLNLTFDTTIKYITASNGADIDQVLIVNKKPSSIFTIQRTCQLNICRDITFEEADIYSSGPPTIQEQSLLDQYATLLFPLASDPREVRDIGTPEVYAPDEAIRYDGSFQPYAEFWRCQSSNSRVMNMQTSVPTNIRTTGAEVMVSLTRYGADPKLSGVDWWMLGYDGLPK